MDEFDKQYVDRYREDILVRILEIEGLLKMVQSKMDDIQRKQKLIQEIIETQ